MKRSFDGKTPGKFWYLRKYTRAITRLPFNRLSRPTIKKPAVQAGISLGSAAALKFLLLPLIGFPIFGAVGVVGGGIVCLGSGFLAFRNIRGLKSSAPVVHYIHEQEEKWVAKKSRPKLRTRVATSVKSTLHIGGKKKKSNAAEFKKAAKPATTDPKILAARQKAAAERARNKKLRGGRPGL